jgi:magnesium chelatase accessory protein
MLPNPATSAAPSDDPLEEQHASAAGLGWRFVRSPLTVPRRPALLLLHGTGSSSRSWAGCAAVLAPHFELLMPDLPGHGGTTGFKHAAASLPRMAHALAALLRALGVAPVAVVGHSAGAALMLQLWLDGALPQARGLLALNGALHPLQGLAGTLFPPLARLMAALPGLPRLASQAAARPRALQQLVASTGSQLGEAEIAHYRGLLQQPEHIAGALQMMAGWDLAPLLPALRQRLARQPIPLLLAAGERDRTVPAAQSQRAALELPGARFRLLPGLGHLAHEERPGTVAALLGELGGVGLSAG